MTPLTTYKLINATDPPYTNLCYKLTNNTATATTWYNTVANPLYKQKVVYKKYHQYCDTNSDIWVTISNAALASYAATASTYPDCYTQAEMKWYDCNYKPPVIAPSDRLREIIQSRHTPAIHISNRIPLMPTKDFRESCARQTLCRIIGENDFRDYMKNGFISVKAKSGLVYQIYPSSGMTHVYSMGEYIEKLCVVLKGDFPPTDSLIMRYILILNDENEFRKLAISHHVIKTKPKTITPDQGSLVEIFKKLKVSA